MKKLALMGLVAFLFFACVTTERNTRFDFPKIAQCKGYGFTIQQSGETLVLRINIEKRGTLGSLRYIKIKEKNPAYTYQDYSPILRRRSYCSKEQRAKAPKKKCYSALELHKSPRPIAHFEDKKKSLICFKAFGARATSNDPCLQAALRQGKCHKILDVRGCRGSKKSP